MNILILNWRDFKNPRSGGAEVVTSKYAGYWASLGHTVTWLCNTFPGCKPEESINNVKIIRIGPNLGFTVFELLVTYPLFLLHAIFSVIKILGKNKIDLIIDEIHGLPFFTPFYSKSRNVMLVCEVAGPIWDKMYPIPINFIGKLLEKVIYYAYRNTETWAISQNTKKDVFDLNKNNNIKILPLGIDFRERPKVKKFSFPSAIFLGRLVKMKGVESAIIATANIVKKLPKFHLYIIGLGGIEYVEFLKKLSSDLHVSKNITFCGRLSEDEKYKLLAQSHFLLHPSYKEGFGLTVLEAGLMGTPTIGRIGSSLSDLINDRNTGLIFTNDYEIAPLFLESIYTHLYKRMIEETKKNSVQYCWPTIVKKSVTITQIL